MHEKKVRRKKKTPSQDHPRDGALKCCRDGHLGRRQDYFLVRAAFLTAAFAAAGFFTAGFFFGAIFFDFFGAAFLTAAFVAAGFFTAGFFFGAVFFDFFGAAFTAFVDAFADNNFFFALPATALPFAFAMCDASFIEFYVY
jgi:hypothetical protein